MTYEKQNYAKDLSRAVSTVLTVAIVILTGVAILSYGSGKRNNAIAKDWLKVHETQGCVRVGQFDRMLDQIVLYQCTNGHYAVSRSIIERAEKLASQKGRQQ